MPFIKYKGQNKVVSTLYSPVGSNTTTFVVKPGDGPLFGNDFPIKINVSKFDDLGRILKNEIALITARSGDNLTVTRRHEACPADYEAQTHTTTSFSFDQGDQISIVITNDVIKDIQDEVSRLETDKLNKSTYYAEQEVFSATVTGNDAYQITSSTVTTYNNGQTFKVQADVGNDGACTLQLNALSAKFIKKYVSGALVNLETGDIVASQIFWATYNSLADCFQFASDPATAPIVSVNATESTFTAGENITAGDAISYVIEDYIYNNHSNFNNANTTNITACKIENNKFLIAYTDVGNSSRGTCIIATISNNIISYGSEYVFNTNSTDGIGVSLLSANKVIIAFRNVPNGYIQAVVGDISGTVITYGTIQTVDAQNCGANCKPVTISSNYFFLNYSGYFGRGNGILGTVSGTVITFGTMVQYVNDNSAGIGQPAVLSGGAIFIPYSYGAGNAFAKIATISGLTISSYGTAYQFTATSAGDITSYAVNSTTVLFSFSDGSNSNKGTSMIATISGSVISYSSKYVYSTGSVSQISIVTNLSNYFIFYKDVANSNYITSVSISISGTVISIGSYYIDNSNSVFLIALNNTVDNIFIVNTLTSDTKGYSKTYTKLSGYFKTKADNINRINFIGFAKSNASSGESVKVLTAGISSNHTGLTVGADYYITNTAGEISTTPGTNTVSVGKAVSTTSIEINSFDKFNRYNFGNKVVIASNNILASSIIEQNFVGTTLRKVREIRVNINGTYRVSFEMKRTGGSGNTVTGVIYKNGTSIGTTRNLNSDIYTRYDQDFTFQSGDYVQLFMSSSDAGQTNWHRNFLIQGDINYLNNFEVLL